MLSFFRRLINSKVGIIVTFVVLGIIALAFAAGDVTGLGRNGGGLAADAIASVGHEKVTSAELRDRAQNELRGAQQQQPSLDMVQFVAQGGLDGTLQRIVNTLALDQFARGQGMTASKRLVDGQIAGFPEFQGPDGKFSQAAYDQLLARARLTDRQIRDDVTRQTMTQHLILPTLGATQVPRGLALPYASLLLERRQGQIAIIPSRAMGIGSTPTPAELTGFYRRDLARYTVPERRIIRYAVVSADQLKASATPSAAEVAQAYQSQRAKFLPTEKRSLGQVVIADRAAAAALAAKVKAGTPIDAAARAAGLEPNMLSAIDKGGYAAQTSPELADAVFAAAKGSVVGPLRSALGFIVVRVGAIEQVAGKSLDQARPELVKALTQERAAAALTRIHDSLDDAIGNHATFDELIADHKLAAKISPPLLANGANPDAPAVKPDAAFAQVVAAAFGAEEGDDPQLVPVGTDSFAVVALGKIVPAAPRAIGEVRDTLVRDFVIDRAQRAARKVAGDVVLQVNKGMPLAQALAATRLTLPRPQPVDATRAQLASNRQGAPPPLVLMFSMAAGRAKLLEAPNNGGWFLIYLDKIMPGDAAGRPNVVNATRADLGKVVGREYIEEFSDAVRRAVGVKKNDRAIAQVKAALSGQGGSGQGGSDRQ